MSHLLIDLFGACVLESMNDEKEKGQEVLTALPEEGAFIDQRQYRLPFDLAETLKAGMH